MKAFIIHINGHEGSMKTANMALESCQAHGYEAELFDGITPKTNDVWDKKFNLKVIRPGHMYDRQIGLNGTNQTYLCKYSNFLNHYRLWLESIERDETIVVLEHDVLCKHEWDNPGFSEMLVLNMECGLYEQQFSKIGKPNLFPGVNEYKNPHLIYRSQNVWHGAAMIPGSAAYAINPKGASRLIKNVKQFGWEKADYIINNRTVKMEYINPDYFVFSHDIIPNQKTSHGI